MASPKKLSRAKATAKRPIWGFSMIPPARHFLTTKSDGVAVKRFCAGGELSDFAVPDDFSVGGCWAGSSCLACWALEMVVSCGFGERCWAGSSCLACWALEMVVSCGFGELCWAGSSCLALEMVVSCGFGELC